MPSSADHNPADPANFIFLIGELKGTMQSLSETMGSVLQVQQEQTQSIAGLSASMKSMQHSLTAVERLASEQLRQAKDISRHDSAIQQAFEDIRQLQETMMRRRQDQTTALVRKSGDWKSALFNQRWLPWFLCAIVCLIITIAAFSYVSGRNAIDFVPVPHEAGD